MSKIFDIKDEQKDEQKNKEKDYDENRFIDVEKHKAMCVSIAMLFKLQKVPVPAQINVLLEALSLIVAGSLMDDVTDEQLKSAMDQIASELFKGIKQHIEDAKKP